MAIMVKDYYGNDLDFEDAMHLADREIVEAMHNANVCMDDPQGFIIAYASLHAVKYDGEEFAPFYDLDW